jgi:asparagine N-glycosylation enzyme membrane subunit Stt3
MIEAAATRSYTSARGLLIAGTLGVCGIAVALECLRIPAVFTHNTVLLPDPDDWMRLWRAEQVADGKALIIRNIPQVDPPTGMEMHWTAPVDYLVAIPGLVWRSISHRSNAFAESAAWLPVALGAIYIATMITFLRRGHDPWTALLAGLFIAISPAFHRNFRLGHCDHHCALEFLYLLAVGLWWPLLCTVPARRLQNQPSSSPQPESTTAPSNSTEVFLLQLYASPRRVLISGLCMGLALWVAPQSMAVWLAILVGLLFEAWRHPPEGRLWWLTSITRWQAAVSIIVCTGQWIERGYASGQLALDRIGPVQA